jgi:hypothetical protein
MHLKRLALKVANTAGPKLHCHTGSPLLGGLWWAPVAALTTWPLARFLRTRLYRKNKLEKTY